MVQSNDQQRRPSKHRRFRFSLATLLIVLTLFAIPCTWYAYNVPHFAAINAIQSEGGFIKWERGINPSWLDEKLGNYRFDKVDWVWLKEGNNDRLVEQVGRLNSINLLDCSKSHPIEDFTPLLKHSDSLATLHLGNLPRNPEAFFEHFIALEEFCFNSKLQSLVQFDIRYLRGMKNLKRLILSNEDPTGFEGLADLESLEELHLSGSEINSLEPLRGLTSLLALDLSGCSQFLDLKPISGLGKLQTLHLERCYFKSSKPIGRLNSLTRLDLPSQKGADLSFLKNLKNLKYLSIPSRPMDYSFLRELQELETLYLPVDFDEFTMLRDCINLKFVFGREVRYEHLEVVGNTELNHLKRLSRLKELSIRDVTDFSPLATMEGLVELRLENCTVKDASPFLTLPNLQTLHLAQCTFEERELDSIKKRLKTKVSFNGFLIIQDSAAK